MLRLSKCSDRWHGGFLDGNWNPLNKRVCLTFSAHFPHAFIYLLNNTYRSHFPAFIGGITGNVLRCRKNYYPFSPKLVGTKTFERKHLPLKSLYPPHCCLNTASPRFKPLIPECMLVPKIIWEPGMGLGVGKLSITLSSPEDRKGSSPS